jgi:SAM-dependent methyltransferase
VTSAYLDLAKAFLAAGIARYGLPSSGPLYDGNLRALIDPDAHDFRIAEFPRDPAQAAVPNAQRTILDLGCGPGTMVLRALEQGYNAWGIDLDDQKITLARAWALERGFPPDVVSRIVIADAGDMPFGSQYFDVVSSYHVLEHVADLPSVLAEAVRVTKRGGFLDLRAPDYRMSYDTHYSMPWPRFMPPKQSRKWAEAMGRPADGVGTFFYVTAPEVMAILQALGCEILSLYLREHRDGAITNFEGTLAVDPVLFRSDEDIRAVAADLQQLAAAGTLPNMYKTCLEFGIVAKRM